MFANLQICTQAAAAPAAMEEEEEEEGDVDDTGVEPKDVELVMTQVRFFYFQPVGNLGTFACASARPWSR